MECSKEIMASGNGEANGLLEILPPVDFCCIYGSTLHPNNADKVWLLSFFIYFLIMQKKLCNPGHTGIIVLLVFLFLVFAENSLELELIIWVTHYLLSLDIHDRLHCWSIRSWKMAFWGMQWVLFCLEHFLFVCLFFSPFFWWYLIYSLLQEFGKESESLWIVDYAFGWSKAGTVLLSYFCAFVFVIFFYSTAIIITRFFFGSRLLMWLMKLALVYTSILLFLWIIRYQTFVHLLVFFFFLLKLMIHDIIFPWIAIVETYDDFGI